MNLRISKKFKDFLTFYLFFLIFFSLAFPFFLQWRLDRWLGKTIPKFEVRLEAHVNNIYSEYGDCNDCTIDEKYFYDGERIAIWIEKYTLSGLKFFYERPYSSPIFKFFEVQGKKFGILHFRWLTFYGISRAMDKFGSFPDKTNTYFEKLETYYYSWIEENPKSNGTWKEFESSSLYQEFLDEVFADLEHNNDESLDEVYENIMQIPDSYNSFWKDLILKPSLEYTKKLAKESHMNYYKHKSENDYISSNIDASMIYWIWEDWEKMDGNLLHRFFHTSPDYYNLTPQLYFSSLNLYFEIILIITIPLLFSILFLALKNRQELHK